MKIIVAVLLLLAAPLAAQTIAPSQIKPGSDGQVLKTTGGKTAWSPGGTSVSSVFGRVGDVAPLAGDYNCGLITGAICSLPALNYQTIKVDGAAQTQRAVTNFINGSAGTVACVDNPVTLATDCTFTGGNSAGITYSIANVSGSHAINVAYPNPSSTNPMYVGGSLATTGSGVGNIIVAQGPTMGSLPFVSWANEATATVSGGDAGFSAVIMPGNYYMVRVSGAVTGTVHNWTEITGSGSGGGGGGGGTPGGSNHSVQFNSSGSFAGTAFNGLVKASTTADPAAAAFSDVVSLWSSCTSGYLKFDGSCSVPSGGGPPTGSAGGALAGSYPNPTIAGLGASGFIPESDGAGNLVASPAQRDASNFVQWPIGGINMIGGFPGGSGNDFEGGIYYSNSWCDANANPSFGLNTGNSENGISLGHSSPCFAGGHADESYFVATGAVHQVVGSSFAIITNVSLTSNVVTITAANSYSPGQFVAVFNLTAAPFLNNQRAAAIISATSTQFTFAFVHVNVPSSSETGAAQVVTDNVLEVGNEGSGILALGALGSPLISIRSGLSPNGIFFPQMSTSGILYNDASSGEGKLSLATSAEQTVTINSTPCILGGTCTVSAGGITFPQTVSGTVNSGGLVYANSGTQISVSSAGTAGQVVLWGGTGTAPGAQAIGTSGATIPLLNTAITFSGAAAASAPSLNLTGTLFTGGSGTTTFPFDYINNGASGPTTFSTSGTEFGINAPSGFAGNFLDFHVNGAGSVFGVGSNGAATGRSFSANGGVAQLESNGLVLGTTFGTATNCASAASPAVCGSAAAGAFTIAAAATTVTVNTTAVTANSEIEIQPDSSLGTRLSVTCNTVLSTVIGPVVTARTAGTSFTVSIPGTLTTNPACYTYRITN